MEILVTIWNFIVSHWSFIPGALTTAKLGADTIDSVKKVLPAQLETKQVTQSYLEKSADILNDQRIPVEDKKWELTTRQELAKSMVQLTAIEATYHVASATVIVTFGVAFLHLVMRSKSGKESKL